MDANIQFRLGNVNAFQLADGLQYTLSHIEQLSGRYHYEYWIMWQIRMCKYLKHWTYWCFYIRPVWKWPGCRFWAVVMWRICLLFSCGRVPRRKVAWKLACAMVWILTFKGLKVTLTWSLEQLSYIIFLIQCRRTLRRTKLTWFHSIWSKGLYWSYLKQQEYLEANTSCNIDSFLWVYSFNQCRIWLWFYHYINKLIS